MDENRAEYLKVYYRARREMYRDWVSKTFAGQVV